MQKLNIINMKTYARCDHYEHYANSDHCTYSITADINIKNLYTYLSKSKLSLYPALICIVSLAVNNNEEFKMAINENKELGYYDIIHPSYCIFHSDDKTFSCCSSKFDKNFLAMYKNVKGDMEKHKDTKAFILGEIPENCFHLSCTPWLKYSALNMNVPYSANFLAPIITWGKFDNDYNLPFTVQINHAVADGYHTCKLINDIQSMINKF